MAFTLETLEDFDQTLFDRGAGWAIVFEIHNAILARAQATQHSLRNTIATPFSGLLWLEEGYDPERPELRTKLTQLYSWVQTLIDGQAGIRWTESSGRSAEWTLSSITADIGMGDFDDLLVKPQRPEPLVWLIAALNRLRHPKITVNKTLATDPVGETAFKSETGEVGGLDPQTTEELWDEMTAEAMDYNNVSSDNVGWYATDIAGSSFAYTAIYSAGGVTAQENDSKLKTVANDYGCLVQASWYSGPDLYVVVGSSDPTNMGSTNSLITTKTVEATDVDIEVNGDGVVSISIDTEIPDSPPFNGFFPTGSPSDAKYGFIRVYLRTITFYCDLPDVIGIGELEAPMPVVAGDNE